MKTENELRDLLTCLVTIGSRDGILTGKWISISSVVQTLVRVVEYVVLYEVLEVVEVSSRAGYQRFAVCLFLRGRLLESQHEV